MNSRNAAVLVIFASSQQPLPWLLSIPLSRNTCGRNRQQRRRQHHRPAIRLGFANANIGVPNDAQGQPAAQTNPTSSKTAMNAGVYYEHRFIPFFGLRTETQLRGTRLHHHRWSGTRRKSEFLFGQLF